jgi:putative ABC transport system permease protein
MNVFYTELKHSLRMFCKNPSFTITAVAALALGIGATTAIFSVIYSVLLRPLPYPDPDKMVLFQETSLHGSGSVSSVREFHFWQKQNAAFEYVSAFDFRGPGLNLTGGIPEQIRGIHVSADYFRLFGAEPLIGRTFTSEEGMPGAGKTAVLSYGLWKRKFESNPNIIGKSISLSGEPYTVIGVIQQGFESDPVADVWLPFQFDPTNNNKEQYFLVAGRLKQGITLQESRALLKLASADFRRQFSGDSLGPQDSFGVVPLQDAIVADVKSSLLVLAGAVSFVLLIACSNVANLILIHSLARRREFAIRMSLGAGRWRVIRQLLAESVLLSLTGGTLGLGLGLIALRSLLAINPVDIPGTGEHGAISLNWHILGFAIGVSILTGVLFGLIPALDASKAHLGSTMNQNDSRSGTGFGQERLRSLFVVSEVSLALVLFVGAALFIRTYVALRSVDPGFDSNSVLTMQMSLTGNRFMKTAGVAQLVQKGRERMNRVPGVIASAYTCCLPLEQGLGLPFDIVGRSLGKAPSRGLAGWTNVSAGYFEVFNIPIVRGRAFTTSDDEGSPRVAIINESMAKSYWPNEDPIGQQIVVGKNQGKDFEEPARQIIGIAGDIRDAGLNKIPRPMMFVPQAQVLDTVTSLTASVAPVSWVIRTHGDPHQVAKAIADQLNQASDGLPVVRIRSMDEIVAQSTARQHFNMLLLSMFGFSALTLAAIGIYGLMTYSIRQRRREIGIRLALGANRTKIRNMVVWQGMRLALAGVVVGGLASTALSNLISSLLFGVKRWDPIVYITAPIVLCIVAFAAVWAPAQQASKLDPMRALQTE